MKSIRLLPIVVIAGFALLFLKGFGLLTEGRYVLSGTQQASAQSSILTEGADQSGNNGGAAGKRELTPDEISAANKASESLFSRAESTPVGSTQLDATPYRKNKAGEKIALSTSSNGNSTEQAVLERLSERRTELDTLESQLEERATLVAAAEVRLAERASALEALETQISVLVEQKKALDDEQFAGLVGMYETMKPKDAASIFNQLDQSVLLRVSTAMNPRKMAPVLAAMTVDRAQELTTLMAAKEAEPSMDAPIDSFSQLPQIVGQ